MAPPTSIRGLGLLALATLRSMPVVARARPRVTIGTGGYACVPACLASWLLRVPIVLFLPDVEPGKAVRALLPLARRVAVTTPDSLRYVNAPKAVLTGYPVRPAFLQTDRDRGRERYGLAEADTVLCVFGGSLGARAINAAVTHILPDLLRLAHVIHVAGQDRLDEVRKRTATLTVAQRARYHLFPYLNEEEMADALAASDLALARSGASVLGELPATGTPAVLVPLPIAGVHQRANAEFLARHGAAMVLDDDRIERDLGGLLGMLLTDRRRLEEMAGACAALAHRDAADHIAAIALEASA
jgi:UDP-N-acetylglucosamine--N-acetylmuramyl-(pentapeptide) pyrophosphoryl-undecaprenol N-acetylglucosamine transferase